MDERITVREIRCSSGYERRELAAFLAAHDLDCEEDTDCAVGIFDSNEELVACGCAAGNILKQFAVAGRFRGENLLGTLLSRLLELQFARGRTQLFLYTKPENRNFFEQSGFFLVSSTEEVALLENRPDGPAAFARATIRPEDRGQKAGAIVLNANPFTLGHRYLVEQAAAHCKLLYLFVVEEDRSLFPFPVRRKLVEEGTRDIAAVRVCNSGKYILSSATFPAYFIKEKGLVQDIRTRLDTRIFLEHIAPLFCIKIRFVGSEPDCRTTALYNDIMRQEFSGHSLNLLVVDRLENSGAPVSASAVRRILLENGPEDDRLRALVPATTLNWLQSADGQALLKRHRVPEQPGGVPEEKIQSGNSPERVAVTEELFRDFGTTARK